MSRKRDYHEVTREEVERTLNVLSTPIDFDGLIEAGVLEKRGVWYKILKMDKLPEHVKRRVIANKKTKDGAVVRFSSIKKR